MNVITKSMGNIVKALDSALASSNLQKISETMDTFEKQFVNMEVQSQFVENAMQGSTALSTPEEDVNMLMQQVRQSQLIGLRIGGYRRSTSYLREGLSNPYRQANNVHPRAFYQILLLGLANSQLVGTLDSHVFGC